MARNGAELFIVQRDFVNGNGGFPGQPLLHAVDEDLGNALIGGTAACAAGTAIVAARASVAARMTTRVLIMVLPPCRPVS
jgi:hypothetical protein